jgi:hypothetical protein
MKGKYYKQKLRNEERVKGGRGNDVILVFWGIISMSPNYIVTRLRKFGSYEKILGLLENIMRTLELNQSHLATS